MYRHALNFVLLFTCVYICVRMGTWVHVLIEARGWHWTPGSGDSGSQLPDMGVKNWMCGLSKSSRNSCPSLGISDTETCNWVICGRLGPESFAQKISSIFHIDSRRTCIEFTLLLMCLLFLESKLFGCSSTGKEGHKNCCAGTRVSGWWVLGRQKES